MPRTGRSSNKFPDNLAMLDDLIRRCYRELLKSIEKHAKLGDFLKMVELRRKLAPGDSDQKQFWKMLEKIRRETLEQDEVKRPTPKKRASKRQPTAEAK
jgi:hypothetical protein